MPATRSSYRIATPIGLGPGDHACWTYSSDVEFLDGLAAYFREGLEAGDKLAFFRDQLTEAEFVSAMEDRGLPVSPLIDSGRMAILDALDSYTTDGSFDKEKVLQAFDQASRIAVEEEGYRALRAAGEMAWAWPHHIDAVPLGVYEFEADQIVSRGRVVGLCAYDTRRMQPELFNAIEPTHHVQISKSPAWSAFRVFHLGGGGVAIEGEVDILADDLFQTLIETAVMQSETSDGKVTFDLSSLTFLDGDGMRTFARLGKRFASQGKIICIQSANPTIRRCFALLGFDRIEGLELS